MNRRSFLAGLLAWLAALVTGRLFRRPPWAKRLPDVPEGFRRLAMPYVIEPGVPIGLLAVEVPEPWQGRIVRQEKPLPGQREACCACQDPGCASDETCRYYYAESAMGRTPVLGSPERAYLEYMAREHPHPEYHWSDSNTLRRIERGELAVDDVLIRLASADEIDVPGGAYAGGRSEAYSTYITVVS